MRLALVVLLFGMVGSVHAGRFDEDRQRERLSELDARCKAERSEQLKVLQQSKVRECVAEGHEKGWCERYFRGYGWGATVGGTRTPNLLYDLPVCEEAFQLRKSLPR